MATSVAGILTKDSRRDYPIVSLGTGRSASGYIEQGEARGGQMGEARNQSRLGESLEGDSPPKQRAHNERNGIRETLKEGSERIREGERDREKSMEKKLRQGREKPGGEFLPDFCPRMKNLESSFSAGGLALPWFL